MFAQLQLAEQNALALTLFVQAQAGGRQQTDQLGGGGGCALAGAALQVATGQQEQGKHTHGVEIQFAMLIDRGPDAGHIGTADGQGHRHVHGQMASAQVAQGTFEKVATAVENNRCG